MRERKQMKKDEDKTINLIQTLQIWTSLIFSYRLRKKAVSPKLHLSITLEYTALHWSILYL